MKLSSWFSPRKPGRSRQPDVVLGEDWVGVDGSVDAEALSRRNRRSVISLNRSPLARKIITFNLIALIFLVAGVLFLNPFRDSLVLQRETGLREEAELIADIFELQVVFQNAASSEGRVSEIRRLRALRLLKQTVWWKILEWDFWMSRKSNLP
ncbi:sensor N-terminal transmembrane domain-containing protein [Halocynthiibacter namhaensis]|uniref:sensor N-terminal transmembrane domain-containing protein n=1 Tax=Halocynthiibacter namhaensis TaxID=1290553 RepID=UPI0005791DBD